MNLRDSRVYCSAKQVMIGDDGCSCYDLFFKSYCFCLLFILSSVLLWRSFPLLVSFYLHRFVCTLQSIPSKETHSPAAVQAEGLEGMLCQVAGVWGRGTGV